MAMDATVCEACTTPPQPVRELEARPRAIGARERRGNGRLLWLAVAAVVAAAVVVVVLTIAG
jgi:hypothetical protein